MPFHPCLLGCGRYLSSDDGHDRCLQCLGIQHAEAAVVDDSCACCGSMASLWSHLFFVKKNGTLCTPHTAFHSAPMWFCWSAPWGYQHFICCAPWRSDVNRSIGGWAIVLQGLRFGGAAPSGVAATAESDPELMAMLARASVSIGLEVNRLPSPEPSRLDDWFLGAGHSSQPRFPPLPFFPEVHEELKKSWTAPFTARSRLSPSSILTTLNSGAARGYMDVPQVERVVAVHPWPQNATTWSNHLRLPSKAWKMAAALAAKAYSVAGQAAML